MNFSNKGIVYLGNLPHGFYEEGIRNFFEQFGEISRLKVKRSDKNAKPMGYAYIEFVHEKVAKVVAKTMDNYLMFKKLLKCKFIRGDTKRIFRKNELMPEFCSGTKRKRKNQLKMETADGEKILKRVEKSKKKFCKILGSKVHSRFLTKTSKNGNSRNPEIKPSEERKFIKKFPRKKILKPTQNSVSNIEKKLNKKVNDNIEELASNQVKLDSQYKTPEKLGKGKKPLYMDIKGEDDEIQLKTPPHVIKRFIKDSRTRKHPKRRRRHKYSKRDFVSSDGKVSSEANSKKPKKQKLAVMKTLSMPDKLKRSATSEIKTNNEIDNKAKANKKKLLSKKFSNGTTDQASSGSSLKSAPMKRNTENKMEEHTVKSKRFKFSRKRRSKVKNPEQKDQSMPDKLKGSATNEIKTNNEIDNKAKANKKKLVSKKFSTGSTDQATSGSLKSAPMKRKTENNMEEHTVKSKRFKFSRKRRSNVKNPKQKEQIKLLSIKKKDVKN